MVSSVESTQLLDNRYNLLEKLGAGGMGIVYRAYDRLTGQHVALKQVTTPGSQLQFASMGDSNDFRLSLAQEFKVLASLRHPNIISVLDYGFDELKQPYFTMELLDDAQNIIEAGREKSIDDKLRLLISVCQALVYLHRRGIIHRDLKPDNVLIVDNQVKVLDFGLAVAHSDIETLSDESIVGTLAYMAPEVLNGVPASIASDLYAVGTMAYEMFAGEHPFDLSNIGILITSIMTKTPDVLDLDVSAGLQSIIAKLLEKNPDDRYADASELLEIYATSRSERIPHETEAIRESFLQAAHFVGRETEIQHLLQKLTDAANGVGSALLVGGESGIGKSRLLDELRTWAMVRGVTVLHGQGITEGGTLYQAWRDPLRRLCLQTDLTEHEASVLKPFVPDLHVLLEREIPDAPPLDPKGAQERFFQVVLAIFNRQTHPILLMLEDIHWAGSGSITLLDRLSQITGESTLMVVASFRNDEETNLIEQLSHMSPMILERLKHDQIIELSKSMLGQSGESKQVVDLLEKETEGNVFFIVEVVRALAEEAGQLDLVGDMTLPKKVFAGGIQTVIQRRLDRIPEEARALLEYAAVIGRQLDMQILKHILGDISFDNWLLAASNAVVLDVQDDNWRFTHDKLRESLLAVFSQEERALRHQEVALAIEHVYGQDVNQAAILAYHWEQAGDKAKELDYRSIAGEQALQNAVFSDAIHHLERGLTLLHAVTDDAQRIQTELKLQMTLAVPLLMTRGYGVEEVGNAYRRAHEICQMIGETPQLFPVIRGLWVFYVVQQELGNALDLGKQLVTLAEETQDAAMLVEAYWCYGAAFFWRGEFEPARDYFVKCMAVYDAQQHHVHALLYGQDPGITALAYLFWTEWMLGYPDQALANGQKALQLAEELQHDFSLSYVQIWLAGMYQFLRDDTAVMEVAGAAVAIGSQNEFVQIIAVALMNLGWFTAKQGDFETALPQYQQGFGIYQAIGAKIAQTQFMAMYAETLTFADKPDEAKLQIEAGIKMAEASGEHFYLAELYRLQGESLLGIDDTAAEHAFRQAIRIAHEQNSKSWELRAALNLGNLLQSQAKTDEAYTCVAGVYDTFNEGFETGDLVNAKQFLAGITPS